MSEQRRPCARCKGEGVYRWRKHRQQREGVCFRCDGSGIDPRQGLTREQRAEARRRYEAWRAGRSTGASGADGYATDGRDTADEANNRIGD